MPKYQSFSFNISPSNEEQCFPFEMLYKLHVVEKLSSSHVKKSKKMVRIYFLKQPKMSFQHVKHRRNYPWANYIILLVLSLQNPMYVFYTIFHLVRATFHMPSSHVWLVVTLLDKACSSPRCICPDLASKSPEVIMSVVTYTPGLSKKVKDLKPMSCQSFW